MTTQARCPKCDAVLIEGAVFCLQCGTKIEEAGEPAFDTVFCPECGAKTSSEFAFCKECGKVLQEGTPKEETPKEISVIENPKEAKKPKPGLFAKLRVKPLLIGAVVLVAVAAIAVSAFVVFGGGGETGVGEHLVYLRDDELQLSNLTQDKPFELTGKFYEGSTALGPDSAPLLSGLICTSSDGRYIFYPDRIAESENSFSYYWRDLTAAPDKQEATKVDSDIIIDSAFGRLSDYACVSDDGSRSFYVKGEDKRLYAYDRASGEKSKLDDNVTGFSADESGNYIIYAIFEDGEYTLYEMTLDGITGERAKIDSASNVERVYPNTKKVFYIKDGSLYYKISGEDKVKIASDVNRVVSVVNETSVYYIKAEEIKTPLADFIDDDLAADDRNTSDPGVKPAYPVQPSPVSPGDSTAYSRYLQDIETWKQTCTRIDEEYEAAQTNYYKRLFHDELRTALGDEDNAVSYSKYSLYYWNNGESTLVAEDIGREDNRQPVFLAASDKAETVVYQKYNMSARKLFKISELVTAGGRSDYYNGYVYDIVSEFRSEVSSPRKVAPDVYVAAGTHESIIECDNAKDWRIRNDGVVCFLDDYNDDKGYGTLMSATIENGAAAKPEKIDEDVNIFEFGNGSRRLIYFKDVSNGAGDLYLDGKRISSDVRADIHTSVFYVGQRWLYNYEDSENLIYYTDFSDKRQNGTLNIYKDGKSAKISDDACYFVAIDENNVAYLFDYNFDRQRGDLKLFDGKESTTIDTDVTAVFWSLRKMGWE